MINKKELKQKILDWFKEYDSDIDTEEKALNEINEWANLFSYSDMLGEWWDLLESLKVSFRIGEMYISGDQSNTFYYYENNKGDKISLGNFDTEVESFDKLIDMFIGFEEKILNQGNSFELSTKKHLTDLVKNYINTYGEEFDFTFINNKGNLVVFNNRSDCDVDYSIYESIEDIENFITIDGGVIIFAFDEVDGNTNDNYLKDYKELTKDKDAYIKYKVDYIIELTWNK